MSVSAIRKRQMVLLKKLAQQVGWRNDMKVALAAIAPNLDLKVFGGPAGASYRLVDKDDPKPEGGSELGYDFGCLLTDGLISVTHLSYVHDSFGGTTNKDPAIKVTDVGFDVLSDYEKPWIAKAIEKEPITFLQIIMTILVGLGGWAIGRYITPAGQAEPAAIALTPLKDQSAPKAIVKSPPSATSSH
jgi:hypothetical protein